jgi:hypothetical protein
VKDQTYPENVVSDEDPNRSIRILARYKGTPVGVVRMKEIYNYFNVEFFGILKEYRHKSIGSRMFYFILGFV